ncbi:hypothetical protein AALP_AAs42393U000300 [Arabis alpina]|uniref:Replication protein A 70 kDa DNA-binding subunit B/D first OB fold domain-containing protein n=1 Tax=Arabis alpina TaxID=50452 RepID=A0A087FXN2_ARAAL|nr:hypothetical protein AALP_AAs42393U000300 [Arabis alpina]
MTHFGIVEQVRDGSTIRVYLLPDLPFFDTVKIKCSDAQAIVDAAAKRDINLRLVDSNTVQFTAESLAPEVQNSIPSSITRERPYLTHPIFNMYHREHELLRYNHKLQSKDISLCHSMIPLGSCTMKLNATTEMMSVTWPSFTNIHPFAPVEQAHGYQDTVKDLGLELIENGLAKYVEWSANMMEEEAKKKLKAAELQCKKNKCIVVRILRTWEARDFRRNNALLSVNCLLVDEKNNSIQASIHPRRLHKFKNKLKEGSIFSVTSFDVQPNLNCYRLSDNPHKIWFNDHTDVGDVNVDEYDIPVQYFRIRTFKDVQMMVDKGEHLPNVIAQVSCIRTSNKVDETKNLPRTSFNLLLTCTSPVVRPSMYLYGKNSLSNQTKSTKLSIAPPSNATLEMKPNSGCPLYKKPRTNSRKNKSQVVLDETEE